jgi:hypothetical protein
VPGRVRIVAGRPPEGGQPYAAQDTGNGRKIAAAYALERPASVRENSMTPTPGHASRLREPPLSSSPSKTCLTTDRGPPFSPVAVTGYARAYATLRVNPLRTCNTCNEGRYRRF